MFRTIDDFVRCWERESASTLKVLRALDAASLGQSVAPGGRTLGVLAWHVVLALPETLRRAGIEVPGPGRGDPAPAAAEMVRLYEAGARAIATEVPRLWTDEMLTGLVPMYGEPWPRGLALFSLVLHQAHHRGQMTVLMRQAGLKVPGIYGPAAEEWAAMGMPAQA